MTEKEFNHKIMPLARPVYSFALNMTGNSEDSADITQDVMIKLWDQRKDLKQIKNPKAWALKITRNLCLDWLKNASRHTTKKKLYKMEVMTWTCYPGLNPRM